MSHREWKYCIKAYTSFLSLSKKTIEKVNPFAVVNKSSIGAEPQLLATLKFGFKWVNNPSWQFIKYATILDKTTSENVFINACYITQRISKSMAFCKEDPLPQFKVASYKHLGIQLSFEDPTTLLPGWGGGGKNRSTTKFRNNAPQVCNFLNSFVQDCSCYTY